MTGFLAVGFGGKETCIDYGYGYSDKIQTCDYSEILTIANARLEQTREYTNKYYCERCHCLCNGDAQHATSCRGKSVYGRGKGSDAYAEASVAYEGDKRDNDKRCTETITEIELGQTMNDKHH